MKDELIIYPMNESCAARSFARRPRPARRAFSMVAVCDRRRFPKNFTLFQLSKRTATRPLWRTSQELALPFTTKHPSESQSKLVKVKQSEKSFLTPYPIFQRGRENLPPIRARVGNPLLWTRHCQIRWEGGCHPPGPLRALWGVSGAKWDCLPVAGLG